MAVGISDYRLSCLVSGGGGGGQAYILARFISADNYLRFGFFGPNIIFQRITAASVGATFLTLPALETTAVLDLECVGTAIAAYVDGVQVGTWTESQGASATSVGIQTQNTSSRFDNLLVRAVV